MKKSTKIILAILAAALALAVLVPVVGIGFGIVKDQIRYSKPANYYADAWNTTFPESAKETYYLSTGGRDFWACGSYTVDPGDDAAFADCLEAPLSEKALKNITALLDDVQAPQEDRPDLEKTYRWKCVSEDGDMIAES